MSGLRMISPYIGRRNGVQSSPSIPKYFNVWLHVHVDTDVIHGNDTRIKIQWVINSQFLDCRRFETTFLEYCKESIQIFLTPIPDEVVHVYQNHCILSWLLLVQVGLQNMHRQFADGFRKYILFKFAEGEPLAKP